MLDTGSGGSWSHTAGEGSGTGVIYWRGGIGVTHWREQTQGTPATNWREQAGDR